MARAALLALRGLGDDVRAAWDELADRALEPNPFFRPEAALAAARHLPGGEDDRLLVVHGDGGGLALALPVRRAARYRRVPVGAMRAWGHAHAFLDTPLVGPDDPVRTWTEALGALRATGAGWLVLERLPGDGPVREALDAALAGHGGRAHVLAAYERPVLRRRPEPTYLEGRLSGQRRKRLRRQRRNLAVALGGEPAIRDRAAPDPGPALERYLALELAGWKGRAGTALACCPGEAAFFTEAMTAFAARGRAEIWELAADGPPAAILCAIVDGGGEFHLKTAFDERHAVHSPGLQLELGLIDQFHRDERVSWVDSCTSEGPSPSALLYADRRPMETVLVPLGGVRARAGAAALRRGLRLRGRLRDRARGKPFTDERARSA
jgi:hypothetical protein